MEPRTRSHAARQVIMPQCKLHHQQDNLIPEDGGSMQPQNTNTHPMNHMAPCPRQPFS
jgi:hypothetical protein